MSSFARNLIVRIVGDDRSLIRAFERDTAAVKTFGVETTSSLGKVDAGFTRLQKVAAGGFIGGVALQTLGPKINEAVQAASDLKEQQTKSEEVFGASAKAIQDWSRTTADALGISERAALEASGTFGNLFSAVGVQGTQAADLSRQLVALASDLASFNNANPADTLAAIRSGLVGEAEPLRRYGVLLSEARVQQVALKETGKDTVDSLTDQEKALARVSIILKDTSSAQGDFARTSEGLANKQRILAAQSEELQASLGKLAVPILEQLTEGLTFAADAATKFSDALGGLETNSDHLTFGDLFSSISDIPDLFVKSLKPPWEWEDVAESQAVALTDAMQKAIDTALGGFQLPEPKVKPPKKGFGTGLKPEDLFGPLITEIPKKLQEALLDIEIDDPENHQAIVKALTAQRDAVLNALDDPRLTRDQRIALKQSLKALNAAIEAEGEEINRAAEKAAGDRQDAIDKANKAAQDARDRQRAGFDNLVDNLTLALDVDRAHDNLAKAAQDSRALEAAIRSQIEVEGKTPALARQLFEQRQETAAIVGEQLQRTQFRALGLDESGGPRIPSADNLRRQFQQLTDRVDTSGVDLPSKLANQLAGAGRLLKGQFGDLTEETRAAIVELFRTIRDTFDSEAREGLATPNVQQINKNAILTGLGLDRDTERQLRARLSGINSQGLSLRASPGTIGAFGHTFSPQPIVIQNETTVALDGQAVGRSTQRFLANDRRSNPKQKRGPNS